MMFATLIYTSTSLIVDSEDTFRRRMGEIQAVSVKNNQKNGVSGFLFHNDKRFVQILEGDFDAVTATYSRIRRDKRHASPRIISFSEIRERSFSHWSMKQSMVMAELKSPEFVVKLSFLKRLVTDIKPQPMLVRDILVAVAAERRLLPAFEHQATMAS